LIKSFRHTLGQSFAFKVLCAFIAVIILVLTTFTVFAVLREGQKEKSSLEEQGEMLARIVARNSIVGVYSENKQILGNITESIISLKNVVAVVIYNADFNKILSVKRTNLSGLEDVHIPIDVVSALQTGESLIVRESAKDFEFITPVVLQSTAKKDEMLYFGDSSKVNIGKVIGYVYITLSKDAYHKQIAIIVLENFLIMLIFVLSSAIIVFFSVQKVTRPLKMLTDNVKALEKGFHVVHIPVKSKDEVGNLALAFNSMVDARGQAEQLLRHSEERYRQLVELSPDGIFVILDGKVVFANAAGAILTGAADPAQVLGRQMDDFVHCDDHEVLRKLYSQVEEKKINSPYIQVRYRHRDEAIVDAEMAAAPFVFNGQQAVLVMARDITERKGMEAKIRNYQKELYAAATEMSTLESRVEERERYLIAADLHDYVGQNLVVLQLKLGLLQRSFTDPSVLRHIEEIRDIIGKTIQYTRSLTVELNPPILVEIGFKAAVESLAEAFEKTHGLTITIKDDGQPIQINTEYRYLFFRCVREILMNVVKHSEASNVEIAMSRSADRMYVTVSDNGIGFNMPIADRKKTGFGLFSIRERMKRLGGYCEIETKPGSGTMVILAMPIQ
jgi:PAS domain S-box-containing protein